MRQSCGEVGGGVMKQTRRGEERDWMGGGGDSHGGA